MCTVTLQLRTGRMGFTTLTNELTDVPDGLLLEPGQKYWLGEAGFAVIETVSFESRSGVLAVMLTGGCHSRIEIAWRVKSATTSSSLSGELRM